MGEIKYRNDDPVLFSVINHLCRTKYGSVAKQLQVSEELGTSCKINKQRKKNYSSLDTSWCLRFPFES